MKQMFIAVTDFGDNVIIVNLNRIIAIREQNYIKDGKSKKASIIMLDTGDTIGPIKQTTKKILQVMEQY